MNKVLMCALLLTAASAWGAATPRGSAYDSRMQNIPYNSQNTTVINTRAGYITTLVFDADEEVITAIKNLKKNQRHRKFQSNLLRLNLKHQKCQRKIQI